MTPTSGPSSRRFLWVATAVALVAGFLLRIDLLDSGFYTDDFDHYAMHAGHYPVPRAPLDKFNFSNGSAADNAALIERGHFPWWSAPNIHLSMLRPLSSALIALDFSAFGLDARWFHWHSFAWWAALVVAVACLLGRLLPMPIAAVAVFLFALEEGHGLPVGWLANRSTLVATTFGVLAVHAHAVFRERSSSAWRAWSIVCIALALASGEYAFGPLAYLFVFELVMREEPWVQRARALAPAAVLAAMYLVVRQSLGFGIDGSGFYISITAEPLAFMRAAAWRVPVLVGDLALGVPADWYLSGSPWRLPLLRAGWFSADTWRALPEWQTWHVAIGAVGLLMVSAGLRLLPKWTGPRDARTLRFLVVGAVLALVPGAGGMVSARLTVAAAIGFDALVAALLLHGALAARRSPDFMRRIGAVLACVALLYVHVDVASARSEGEAVWLRRRAQLEFEWVMAAEVDAQQLPAQRVYVVSTQDLTSAWYLPYARAAVGASMPRSYTLLSGASQPHDFVRVSDRAFDLFVLTNNVEVMAVGGNYRSAEQPFRVGDVVEFQGVRAEVIRVLRGQPQGVRFTFPTSLDDSQHVFLESSERGLRRIVLPRVGESLRLRRPVYPNAASLQWQHDEREKAKRRTTK